MITTQFQKILGTPINNNENSLKESENLVNYLITKILLKLEQLFPIGQDYSQLNQIFQNKHDYTASRIHKLLKYLFKLINQNLITKQAYKKLEEQTQKLQLTIRNHIKMEHQMKMYLDYLEAKLEKKKTQQKYYNADYNLERVQLEKLKTKEVILIQETENLKKKNQLLSLELQKIKKAELMQQFQNNIYQSQNEFSAQYLTKDCNNRQRNFSQYTDKGDILINNKVNKSAIQNLYTQFINTNYEDNPQTLTKKNQKLKQVQNYRDMSKLNLKRYSNHLIQCEVLQKINQQTTQKKKSNKFSSLLQPNY